MRTGLLELESAANESTPTARVMRVMTPNDGDLRMTWDPAKPDEVERVRAVFDEMKAKGYTAFRSDEKGKKASAMKTFDPDAEAIILAPPIVGG